MCFTVFQFPPPLPALPFSRQTRKKGSFGEHSHKVPTVVVVRSPCMWSESQIELRSFQVFNYRRNGLLCLVAHITLFHLDLRTGERGFNTSLNCNHPELDTYVPSAEYIGSTSSVVVVRENCILHFWSQMERNNLTDHRLCGLKGISYHHQFQAKFLTRYFWSSLPLSSGYCI